MKTIAILLAIMGALAVPKASAWTKPPKTCDGADDKVIAKSITSFKPKCTLQYIYPTIGVFYGVTFVYKCRQSLHGTWINHYITFTSGVQQYGIIPRDLDGNYIQPERYKKFYDVSKEEPEIPEISRPHVVKKKNIICSDISKVLAKANGLSPRPA